MWRVCHPNPPDHQIPWWESFVSHFLTSRLRLPLTTAGNTEKRSDICHSFLLGIGFIALLLDTYACKLKLSHFTCIWVSLTLIPQEIGSWFFFIYSDIPWKVSDNTQKKHNSGFKDTGRMIFNQARWVVLGMVISSLSLYRLATRSLRPPLWLKSLNNYWTDWHWVHLRLQLQTEMNSLTLWHLTSAFVRTCLCQLKLSAYTTTINPGLQLNSGSFIRPRRRPTDVRAESCTTRPETQLQRRSE